MADANESRISIGLRLNNFNLRVMRVMTLCGKCKIINSALRLLYTIEQKNTIAL